LHPFDPFVMLSENFPEKSAGGGGGAESDPPHAERRLMDIPRAAQPIRFIERKYRSDPGVPLVATINGR
jgi:hypothetical protein